MRSSPEPNPPNPPKLTMRVAIRTDASLNIGTGHVMRCLTLADALRGAGAICIFVCRYHPGNLTELIRARGFDVRMLETLPSAMCRNVDDPRGETTYADWLGASWGTDARQTRKAIGEEPLDWLIADHYALNAHWERALRPSCLRLMVIDDLADRPHDCDLLLDQNLGREPEDYAKLVPEPCLILAGPRYALLRREFAALRPYSLQRRLAKAALRELIIVMGGVDQPNATGQALQALKTCALSDDCRITVVMGLTAPWLQNVRELAAQMPWPTEVVANVNDMAQRMADSDLAIGAAGGTSWERCCLGLPTLMVVLAANQQPGAKALEAAHAARLAGPVSEIANQLPLAIHELNDPDCLKRMSFAASSITDGGGVAEVLQAMGMLNV